MPANISATAVTRFAGRVNVKKPLIFVIEEVNKQEGFADKATDEKIQLLRGF